MWRILRVLLPVQTPDVVKNSLPDSTSGPHPIFGFFFFYLD